MLLRPTVRLPPLTVRTAVPIPPDTITGALPSGVFPLAKETLPPGPMSPVTAFTVAVNQRHDSVLFRFFLGIGTVLGLAADESFVDLDNVALSADWRRAVWRHAFADTMAKKPSAFICDPEHAGQLKGAHTLFAGGHKVIG